MTRSLYSAEILYKGVLIGNLLADAALQLQIPPIFQNVSDLRLHLSVFFRTHWVISFYSTPQAAMFASFYAVLVGIQEVSMKLLIVQRLSAAALSSLPASPERIRYSLDCKYNESIYTGMYCVPNAKGEGRVSPKRLSLVRQSVYRRPQTSFRSLHSNWPDSTLSATLNNSHLPLILDNSKLGLRRLYIDACKPKSTKV